MKLPSALAVLVGIAVLVAAFGCSTTPPAEVALTPHVEATAGARAKESVAAQPPATSYPTYTSVPMPTHRACLNCGLPIGSAGVSQNGKISQ
jgi:hypothetical protein